MAHRLLTAHLKPHERIICAYDRSTFSLSNRLLVSSLGPHIGMWKIGLEAEYALTPGGTVALEMRSYLKSQQLAYMYDGKFKDIGNTVTRAVQNVCEGMGPAPKILTIHATTCVATIVAALKAAGSSLVAGVSLLTDHEEADAWDIYNQSANDVVVGCVERLLRASELTGKRVALVCAPKDLLIFGELFKDYRAYDEIIKITANVRDKDAPPDDQSRERSMTAAEAIEAGADYLVIGRPILNTADPIAAAQSIATEIASAL